MQKCIYCQQDIPDNSRFCPYCGRNFLAEGQWPGSAQVETAREEPPRDTRQANAAERSSGASEQMERTNRVDFLPPIGGVGNSGQVPTISGTPSFGHVPGVSGSPSIAHVPTVPGAPAVPQSPISTPAGPPAGHTIPSARPPFPREVGHTGAQSPGHGQGGSRIDSVQQTNSAQSAPHGQRIDHAQHGPHGQQIAHGQPGPHGNEVRQPGSSAPARQIGRAVRGHTGAHAAIKTGITTKIIASIVAGIVIIAVGAGAIVFAQHNSSAAGQATPAVSQRGVTQPVPPTSIPTPTPSPTPVPPANVFTVSGAISGTMTVVSFRSCGPLGRAYGILAIATLNGTSYNLNIVFPPYHGPGTYTNSAATDAVNVNLNNPAQTWISAQSHLLGSGIINSDGNTGSLSGFTLYSISDSSTVQFAGNWRCS